MSLWNKIYHSRFRWLFLGGLIFAFCFLTKLAIHFHFYNHYRSHFFYDSTAYFISQGTGSVIDGVERGPFVLFVHQGDHFVPMLVLLSLFYAIAASPIWLFALASLCITLAVIPILKLAETYFGKKGIVAGLLLCFFYLPFRNSVEINHYAEVFMMPFAAWAGYFAIREKPGLAVLVGSLAFMAKESGGLVAVGVGLYLLIAKRDWKWGSLAIGIGVLGILLLTKIWIPAFVRQTHYGFIHSYYSYLGEGLSGKLKTLLFSPGTILKVVLVPDRLIYAIVVLSPLAFLPVLNRTILLSMPLWAQLILGKNPRFYDLYSHYICPIVPLLVLGFFLELHYRSKTPAWPKWRAWVKRVVVFFIVLNSLHFLIVESRMYVPRAHYRAESEAIQLIPKSASVSASSAIASHLVHRDFGLLSNFPEINDSEYVIVETVDPFWPIYDEHVPFLKSEWGKGNYKAVLTALYFGEKSYMPVKRKKYAEALDALIQNSNYEIFFKKSSVIIFKRKK